MCDSTRLMFFRSFVGSKFLFPLLFPRDEEHQRQGRRAAHEPNTTRIDTRMHTRAYGEYKVVTLPLMGVWFVCCCVVPLCCVVFLPLLLFWSDLFSFCGERRKRAKKALTQRRAPNNNKQTNDTTNKQQQTTKRMVHRLYQQTTFTHVCHSCGVLLLRVLVGVATSKNNEKQAEKKSTVGEKKSSQRNKKRNKDNTNNNNKQQGDTYTHAHMTTMHNATRGCVIVPCDVRSITLQLSRRCSSCTQSKPFSSTRRAWLDGRMSLCPSLMYPFFLVSVVFVELLSGLLVGCQLIAFQCRDGSITDDDCRHNKKGWVRDIHNQHTQASSVHTRASQRAPSVLTRCRIRPLCGDLSD